MFGADTRVMCHFLDLSMVRFHKSYHEQFTQIRAVNIFHFFRAVKEDTR